MAHTPESRIKARKKLDDRRAAWFAEYGPCEFCGSSERLEMHHRDPATKESHAVWTWAEPRMRAELAKCAVLCRACHHKLHGLERRRHGVKGFRRGCRCEACRLAIKIVRDRYFSKTPRRPVVRESYRDKYVITHDDAA